MVKVSVQYAYAILLAVLNGVVLAVSYLATQNTANGLTITVGIQAVLVGVEGAIHYEQAQPTTSTSNQGTLAEIQTFVQTMQTMFQTTPQATSTPAVTTVPDQDVGTYQGWTVKIVGGRLNLYPPAAMASVLGSVMSLGSVAGWPSNTDWLSLAQSAIAAATQAYQNAISQKPPVVIPPT